MNAMEKMAWTEILISVVAVILAVLLVPWLGDRATTGFALLGLLPLGMFFLRPRGNEVVVDERDRQIESRAKYWGIGTAWLALLMALIAAGMWASYAGTHVVSTRFLNWLTWTQFAICFGVKGLASVVMYRRQQHAA